MKEFRPWSKVTYEEAIDKYKSGRLSILDVQISGKCNYNCVYCDSPDRHLPCEINFDHLEMLIRSEPHLYKWMFVCGLGEPLWAENKQVLLRLLSLCSELNIKCSIFTNGSQIDENILNYVRAGVLYPIIKIDTFSLELSNSIYGTKDGQKTLNAIESLFEIARASNTEFCSVAASIVPTKKNLDEMLDIVKRCFENNVFPLLGQLEYAGNAIGEYDSLLLTKEELLKLRLEISKTINEDYRVPICPSVVAGLHITSDGYISVDKKSGLSCSWFWLETPQTVKLCNVNMIKSFSDADSAILSYRNETLEQMVCLAEQIEEYPFGGCGGNVKDLAQEYIKLQSSLI